MIRLKDLAGVRKSILQLAVAVGLSVAWSVTCANCAAGEQSACPVYPGSDWDTASPEARGLDKQRLSDAVAWLAERLATCGGTEELMIVRNGHCVFRGPHVDCKHCVWSVTKCFTSTVLGHLVDREVCTLDSKAADYVEILRADYAGVTLRHLVTMTSGYDAVGGSYIPVDPEDGSKTPLCPTRPSFAPGTRYSYFDDAVRMNGYVLTRVAGTDLDDYFRRHIARAIGIADEEWEWAKTVDNVPTGFDWTNPDAVDVRDAAGGMRITARGLARFGYLFLHEGRWNNQQVISAQWVRQATSLQVSPSLPFRDNSPRQRRINAPRVERYGFGWDTNVAGADGRRLWPDAPAGTYFCSGYNTNMCIVLPEWEMVIVRTGTRGVKGFSLKDWNTLIRMLGDAITTPEQSAIRIEPGSVELGPAEDQAKNKSQGKH